jgi:hypothetical protein
VVSPTTDSPGEALVGAAMLPPVETPPTPKAGGRKRARCRFTEINEFIDFTMAKLTPAARSVWLILWRDTKPNGQARTGQKDLARRAGVSDRAVRDALVELTGVGVVKVVRKGRIGIGPSTYRVRGMNPDQHS